MTVAITRLELSASELREASARTKEAKVARRMLAIGLVLDDLVAGGGVRGVRDCSATRTLAG